ncbi:hypothetical protein [Pseudomonas hamedanensis]|uniref:RiboL-PSP-HEPN domain-containing protein n=1 Tax=Pseudomonas hamedanensis TaxID=2745504 RepID=A0A9E6TIN7_9PSED|nr:hypothetical protein [Pseudomonas hamedanensis]QXI18863.1 hypothetical protein HU739_007650 [Pseudomonas hamedanensis]
MALTFDRWVKPEQTSWALWQFSEYEAQLNNMYWSSVALEQFAMHHVRKSPEESIKSVLKASGPNAARFDAGRSVFLKNVKDMGNWKRASFIMAATGAMENYFQRAVLVALKSDPALLHGKSKAIDGVQWLKIGIDVDHSEILTAVTKGSWGTRYSKLKSLFGELPDIRDNVDDLDKIRVFRNGVGHAFGRELDAKPRLLRRGTDEITPLTEEKFKKWLGQISGITREFDRHVVQHHIGDFESLLYLHEYIIKADRSKFSLRRFSKAFKSNIGQEQGHSKSIQYYEDMITYYDSVV